MADEHPTVWAAKPHTLAKHAILRRYLEAWYPILARQSRRAKTPSKEILFVDGFAGPGEYEGGEPGSPVIALETTLRHDVNFPVPVRLLFIEKSDDRFQHLENVLGRYRKQVQNSRNVRLSHPCQGECDPLLTGMLDEHEQQGLRFGPALAFLDQFGYAGVSMELIQRILAYPQCEAFVYLDYKDMNRWITDPSKASGFSRTYGGEEWHPAVSLPERERRRFLLDTYKSVLRSRGGASYVCTFAMFDTSGQLLYWLVFCTNNVRGLEEMKKAMWKVDKTGSFRFSDRDDPDQLFLLKEAFDQRWLAEELAAKLADKQLTVSQVKEFVLTETPCYLFKGALRTLETRREPGLKVISAPSSRRRGEFPSDEIVVQFASSGLF